MNKLPIGLKHLKNTERKITPNKRIENQDDYIDTPTIAQAE